MLQSKKRSYQEWFSTYIIRHVVLNGGDAILHTCNLQMGAWPHSRGNTRSIKDNFTDFVIGGMSMPIHYNKKADLGSSEPDFHGKTWGLVNQTYTVSAWYLHRLGINKENTLEWRVIIEYILAATSTIQECSADFGNFVPDIWGKGIGQVFARTMGWYCYLFICLENIFTAFQSLILWFLLEKYRVLAEESNFRNTFIWRCL